MFLMQRVSSVRRHPLEVREALEKWVQSYGTFPSREQKHQLAQCLGLRDVQLDNWFTNFRKRKGRKRPDDEA